MKEYIDELILKRKLQLQIVEVAIKHYPKKDIDNVLTTKRFLISFISDLELLKEKTI